MSTFENQKDLKKLPIPPLNDTIERYLSVLKPLQTETEHNKTIESCENFMNTTGPLLQQQLMDYSNSRPSYIEQFWFDSYLNYDSPVVLNLNPFIMIEDDPTPLNSTQISRASSLTTSSLRFIRALRKNELSIDKLKNNQPLDMDQYPKLFGSARIPTKTGCVLQTDSYSKHIVILSNSQFYWFDVLDENNDLILNENEIKLNFKNIIADSKNLSLSDIAKSSFGVLTTENRRIWANLRNTLNNNLSNKKILSIVDSALFIVVLDNIEVGSNSTKMSQNFLCGESRLENGIQIGTCTNRWYDKLQLIITEDAKCGINFEHTGVDGHTVLRFASDIYTDSILRFAKTINNNSPSLWKSIDNNSKIDKKILSENYCLVPRKLEWELTKEISLALRFAETRLSDLIHQNEFSTLEYKQYGMEKIKKMGLSPDAFVQMSFQLAYYALYGKVECTYEPAMTKKFLHGRTEAIRTVSLESNLFVTKFLNENITASTKFNLLKNACNQHSKITRECSNGLGQDRHLYALFCTWQRYFGDQNNHSDSNDMNSSNDSESTINFNSFPTTFKDNMDELKEIPSIFADSGWDKLNNTIISTSNCGNPSLKLFGFGPVSSNGFGLGYIIKDNSISICGSSKHRQTERFLNTLNTTLNELERTYIESTSEPLLTEIIENKILDESNIDIMKKLEKLVLSRNKSELLKLLGGYDPVNVDSNSDFIKSRDQSPEPPFNRHTKGFTTREIGKKLRLSEY